MRDRLIFGLAMAAAFLLCLWLLPTPWLLALFCVISAVAAGEWRHISRSSTPVAQLTLAIVVLLLIFVGLSWVFYAGLLLQIASTAVASLAIAKGRIYPLIERTAPVIKDFAFILSCSILLACLYYLPGADQGWQRWMILFVLGVVAMADIGAYIAGRSLGKHLLAPSVSPKKTWEGMGGGMGAAMIWALAWTPYFSGHDISGFLLVLVALFDAGYSVFGDLIESAFKRDANVKDSGSLPGHGGVLDRIDAMIAGVPLMTLLLLVF